MIIGFTQRTQTVSESMAQPGEESFPLPIHVATLRTAGREYSMIFRLQVSSSSAIVEPIGGVVNPIYDARFGTRDNIREPIEVFFFLETLEDTIPSLTTFIRNDLRPEYEECFTIRIHSRDVHGHHVHFYCNEDDSGATNYFCQTEICIEDDDGRFATFDNITNSYLYVSEPFVVAFVETTYTVDESVGAVEVCVNLTQPMIDILEERVNVFVIDNSSSVNIPPGAPLASESSPKCIFISPLSIPTAPDEPNFLSVHSMADGTDFAQQTPAINVIDDTFIIQEMRLICYNQPIYDDNCLEPNEYAGLTLGVIDNSNILTTVFTEVKPMYDQASILIVDNDSEFINQTHLV